MLLKVLPVLYVGLCVAAIAICCYIQAQLKQFLERNLTIADERALNEYIAVVRVSMYLGLAGVGILVGALCVSAVLICLMSVLGIVPVTILGMGIVLGLSQQIGKLEKKARSLTAATPHLERRYRQISTVWAEKVLPNF